MSLHTDLVRAYLNEIGSYPLLTKADEVELARIIEAGRDARHELATSDSIPARCSYFHSVLPVSAEIAHTLPIFSAPCGWPGTGITGICNPYTAFGSRVSTVVRAVMHVFCSG